MPAKINAAASNQLSTSQLHELRTDLIAKRQSLLNAIEALEDEANVRADCTILDAIDAASFVQARRRAVNVMQLQQQTLAEVEAALLRIKENRYGICEKSGSMISYERLQVLPWAREALPD